MDAPKKRGRRATYTVEQRSHFAELVRAHGAHETCQRLGGRPAVVTLLKIAKELGIELKKGRRAKRAA